MIDLALWARRRWRRHHHRIRLRDDLRRIRLNTHMARDIGLPPEGPLDGEKR